MRNFFVAMARIPLPIRVFGATFLFICLAYMKALGSDFLSLDDHSLVFVPQLGPLVSLEQLAAIFTPGTHVDFYPIRDLSYLLVRSLAGDSPLVLRLLNVAVFAAAAAVLWQLLADLGMGKITPALVIPWILHPYHSELILWISSTKDLLAILFALISSLYAIRSRYGVALFWFQLSALSKASFLLLPLAVPTAYVLLPHLRSRKYLLFSLGAAASVAFHAILQSAFYSVVNDMSVDIAFVDRLPIVLTSLGKMAAGWLVPSINAAEFDIWGEWAAQNGSFLPFGILFLGSLMAATVYAWISERKTLFLLLLVASFLLAAVPNIVFPHRGSYSVRYLEPCFLALLLSLGLAIKDLSFPPKIARILKFAVPAFCAILLVATYMESAKWSSGLRLRLDALLLNPENISLKSSLLTEIVNLKPAENSELSALRTRLVQELEQSCALRQRLEDGPRSPALNCRFFYMDAFRLSLWKGNFALAQQYLGRLEALKLGNIMPEQQLHRLRFELAIASGTATSESAAKWLAKDYVAADPLYRNLELFAHCLAGQEAIARERRQRWTRASLLEKKELFEIHPRFRAGWRSCLAGS